MDLGLSGLKALVTGSTAGIGLGITESLLSEGCSAVVSGRNQERLRNTVECLSRKYGVSVEGFQCDFCQTQSVDALVKDIAVKWDCLDILVCNVGSGRSVPALCEDENEWQKIFNVNLSSAIRAVYGLLPLLKKSSCPSVVLISSICGVEALGAPICYSVAKSAIISLAANLARPLGEYGIRINVVSPGNILFSGSVWEKKIEEDAEKVKKLLDEVPLKRLGVIEEIADVVAFLSSPKASFITGSNIIIDGGQTRSIR